MPPVAFHVVVTTTVYQVNWNGVMKPLRIFSTVLPFGSVYIGTNIQSVLIVYRDSALFNSDYLHFFQFLFVTVGNCGHAAVIFGLCAQFLHFYFPVILFKEVFSRNLNIIYVKDLMTFLYVFNTAIFFLGFVPSTTDLIKNT